MTFIQGEKVLITICLLSIIGLGLSISGCEINKKDKFTTSYTYSVVPNRQITIGNREISYGQDSTYTVNTLSLQKGSNIVFQYEKKETAPPEVMDGGYYQTVYLEIPAGTTEFEFRDSELSQAKTYFKRECFCSMIGAIPVTQGFVRGEQISGNLWIISASLNITSSVAPQFEESYKVTFDDIFIEK